MKNELLSLTRQLRRRVEQSHEAEFDLTGPKAVKTAGAAAGAAAAVDASALPFEELRSRIIACRLCPLGASRLNPVVGVGARDALVMFIGEGPGFEEDHRGEPFVGRSGQLLDKILASIGLSRRTNAYIANIVKCHPMKDPSDPESRANDRPPTPEEMSACRPYLDEQIRLIRPKVLVTLGASAARALLGEESISKVRGQWRLYKVQGVEQPLRVLPTYHPAALLRNPNLKKDVWADMKALREAVGLVPPQEER